MAMSEAPARSKTSPPSALVARHVVGALAVAIAAIPLAGCARALFPEDAPRTQYERYDRMRNHFTPTEEPDVFGNPRPALRARLTPPE
jgi:hypothetical protein